MALTRRYRKNLKGGKRKRKRKTIRKRRKSRRKMKKRGGVRMRLTKMKRRLNYLKRRVKKQRGGSSHYKCNLPTNVGEIFTGVPLNKNPYLPDPKNSNTNIRGGQKGGGLMDDIGLGDALLTYYKGTNAISNLPIRYNGGKLLMKADPMHQPGLVAPVPVKTTPNIPNMYNVSSGVAAQNTIS